MQNLPETKNTGLITTIDTNSENYQEELNEIIEKEGTKAIGAFDAIGGTVSGVLFNSLAPGGTLYSYGSLSLRPMDIKFGLDFIFKRNEVKPLILMEHLRRNPEFIQKYEEIISEDLKLTGVEERAEESIFATKIGFEV